jgi:tRNA pseudouridine38-40 synthase
VQTFLLTISYHGGTYSGWQRQDGYASIQQHLEEGLSRIFHEPVIVYGAGRTDAGVHALRQAAHIQIPRDMDAQELLSALNGNVPRDIAVVKAQQVPDSFHARFSAIGKRYVYRFLNSSVRPVHGEDLFHWVRFPMSVQAMREAAPCLIGEHDFAAFATNPGYSRLRGTVRRISHVRIVERPHGIDLVVQGKGFLYNQVRTIAGTLQQVATGKIPPQRVPEILLSKDRRQAGMTAPACGLYLVRVLYAPDALRMNEPNSTV